MYFGHMRTIYKNEIDQYNLAEKQNPTTQSTVKDYHKMERTIQSSGLGNKKWVQTNIIQYENTT